MRLADDRHHRLRLVGRQRTKARALAARHHDGLHRRSSSELHTYSAAATTAAPRPIQKSHKGQLVALCVTMRVPMAV